MGLAVSTKGPVGLAVPLVSIVTFLLCCKDFDTLKRFSVLTGFYCYSHCFLLAFAGLYFGWRRLYQQYSSETDIRQARKILQS